MLAIVSFSHEYDDGLPTIIVPLQSYRLKTKALCGIVPKDE